MTRDDRIPFEPVLLNQMNDGRQIKTHACQCGVCAAEFFVRAMSREWTPNFCPYCGVKFQSMKTEAATTAFADRAAREE